MISQGKGAEIAGLSRADFLDALFRAKVPASQVTIEELSSEDTIPNSVAGAGVRASAVWDFLRVVAWVRAFAV